MTSLFASSLVNQEEPSPGARHRGENHCAVPRPITWNKEATITASKFLDKTGREVKKFLRENGTRYVCSGGPCETSLLAERGGPGLLLMGLRAADGTSDAMRKPRASVLNNGV